MSTDVNDEQLQTGLNRLALVAMYRQWMELDDVEKIDRVQGVINENDLDGALDVLSALASGLGLNLAEPETGTATTKVMTAGGVAAMDGPYL